MTNSQLSRHSSEDFPISEGPVRVFGPENKFVTWLMEDDTDAMGARVQIEYYQNVAGQQIDRVITGISHHEERHPATSEEMTQLACAVLRDIPDSPVTAEILSLVEGRIDSQIAELNGLKTAIGLYRPAP